jgi:hypothetical protein
MHQQTLNITLKEEYIRRSRSRVIVDSFSESRYIESRKYILDIEIWRMRMIWVYELRDKRFDTPG